MARSGLLSQAGTAACARGRHTKKDKRKQGAIWSILEYVRKRKVLRKNRSRAWKVGMMCWTMEGKPWKVGSLRRYVWSRDPEGGRERQRKEKKQKRETRSGEHT